MCVCCSIVQTIFYVILSSLSKVDFIFDTSSPNDSNRILTTKRTTSMHMKYDEKFIHIFIAFKTINFDSLNSILSCMQMLYHIIVFRFLHWNFEIKHFDAVELRMRILFWLSRLSLIYSYNLIPALHHQGLDLETGTVRCHWK